MSRLRGARDLAALIAPRGASRNAADALAASVRPPKDVTVAVRVAWAPPWPNGSPVTGYVVERARGRAARAGRDRPPPAGAWARIRGVVGAEADLVDVPPTDFSVWWYRVAARNRVGVSDVGAPARIDVALEALEAAPHLLPLEAPPPPPLAIEAATAPGPAPAPAPAPAPVAPPEGDPLPALGPPGGPLARLRRRPRRRPSGPVDATLASGVFFNVLNVETPLPRSTMTSTFR